MNPDAGHHSPLFKSNSLNQPKMTIQGMVEFMLSGPTPVPKEKVGNNLSSLHNLCLKLIVALSAEAMSQHFADDLKSHRTWETRHIGEPVSRINGGRVRSNGPGVVTQTEVCEILKKETTISHFLHELGVSYLVNNENEFIAFDNKRSIQIKANNKC